jgi:hypothetical protein
VPIQHVPLKIAVPLLEHASQEDPDDEIMIRLWAKMLASAATNDAVSPRFVSLLSEMNKLQVLLLLEVFNFEDVHRDDLRGFVRGFSSRRSHSIRHSSQRHISWRISSSRLDQRPYLNTYTPLDARKTPIWA